jgi:hypothetical protein
MLKKTLIAVTAAGLIAAGSLATATAASAAGPGPGPGFGMTFGGPGWSVGIGTPGFHGPPPHFRPHRVCEPVFKKVNWWWHGHPHWRVIKVGEKCHWVFPPKHMAGPYPWPGPNPGPHPGPYPMKPPAGPYPY